MELKAIDPILALAVAATCGCIVLALLHILLRRRLKRLARTYDERQTALKATVADIQASLSQMSESLAETRGQVGLLEPPPPARSGMNISIRTSALRLHRVGKSPTEIAEALRVPEQEVLLLVKVHQLSLRRLEAGKELGKQLSPN